MGFSSAFTTKTQLLWGVGIFFLLAIVVIPLSLWLDFSPGPDWHTFYEATRYFLRGQSPYLQYRQSPFAYPPWALLMITPIAVLFPEKIGGFLWFSVSIMGFALVLYRMKANPFAFAFFLAAPTTVHCLLNGNIDWLPLLGFTLTPKIGLLFVLIKPQIGIALAIYWIVEAYREGGFRRAMEILYPTLIAYGLSFGIYGFWPSRFFEVYQNSLEWNASFFPYTVPIGLFLLGMAIYRQDKWWSYGASPCLSPYSLFHIWNAALIMFIRKPWLLGGIVAILWGVVLSRL